MLLLRLLSFSIVFLVLLSGNLSSQPAYVYTVPEELHDGWETASLESVQMDSEIMEDLINDLNNIPEHFFHSILVIKNNRLVFEEYFKGQDADLSGYTFKLADPVVFDMNTLHFMASATKSIISILTGIAIDKGYLEGTQQKLFSFFPEYSALNSRRKGRITLYHLLTMTSGMLISEDFAYSDPRNELNQMWHAEEPVKFALEKKLQAVPGKKFIYNSGNVILLGEIIRRSSGKSIEDFARTYLFTPLEINNYKWIGFEHDREMTFASTVLFLRPRDMAKIGQLYLQQGIWNGNTIVSPDWIRESTNRESQPPADLMESFHTDGYGYLWWLEKFNGGSMEAYSARGHGLQFLVIIPDVEMVVVFTGGAWSMAPSQAPVQYSNIIEEYVLRALQ